MKGGVFADAALALAADDPRERRTRGRALLHPVM